VSAIHPTALVDPKARLHDSVQVGPYSIIGPDVEIGEGTWIGPHVVIHGPTVIGSNNRIFQFASLGEGPQDKKYRGEPTRLTIGDGNTIREYVTMNRGTVQDLGETRVGNDNWVMAAAHIAHDCVVGNHTILANSVLLAGHVTIGDWAILGGFAGIHQFCQVGAHSFVAGGAVVLRDVPPFVMSEGQPARPRGINKEGLRRRGFTPEDITEIEEIYRLVYRSGRVMAQVKEALGQRAAGSIHAAGMLDFINKSKRALQR
jgi:UDP-N-acetylglucosamine acyltransferase